jgi:hypothetical protein
VAQELVLVVLAAAVELVPAVALLVPAVAEATVRLVRRGRRRTLWPRSVASLQARPAPALPQVVQHLEATQMAQPRADLASGPDLATGRGPAS